VIIALERRSDGSSTRRLSCLVFDEPQAVDLGKAPVFVDGRPAGYITSAAFGYHVGHSIAYALLPAAAMPGARRVDYFGERLPATVSSEPLFDPEMTRLRR